MQEHILQVLAACQQMKPLCLQVSVFLALLFISVYTKISLFLLQFHLIIGITKGKVITTSSNKITLPNLMSTTSHIELVLTRLGIMCIVHPSLQLMKKRTKNTWTQQFPSCLCRRLVKIVQIFFCIIFILFFAYDQVISVPAAIVLPQGQNYFVELPVTNFNSVHYSTSGVL